jgi:hypothetical protein
MHVINQLVRLRQNSRSTEVTNMHALHYILHEKASTRDISKRNSILHSFSASAPAASRSRHGHRRVDTWDYVHHLIWSPPAWSATPRCKILHIASKALVHKMLLCLTTTTTRSGTGGKKAFNPGL